MKFNILLLLVLINLIAPPSLTLARTLGGETHLEESSNENKGTCQDSDYSSRPESCAIPNSSQEIQSCCSHDGAVYCGEQHCTCYLGEKKEIRLAQKSGINKCD